jgi:hypothetical protein
MGNLVKLHPLPWQTHDPQAGRTPIQHQLGIVSIKGFMIRCRENSLSIGTKSLGSDGLSLQLPETGEGLIHQDMVPVRRKIHKPAHAWSLQPS